MNTKIPRDNLHFSWRYLDGFNKMYNIGMSPREPGKTDTTWWEKIYTQWKENKKPWMYCVRQSVEITEAMIQDIEDTLNKWSIEEIKFEYKTGQFKESIVDIRINKELFFRVVSLSITLRRLKLAKIPNIGGVFFDEYIINPKTGEKYGKDEAFKLKEAYNTWKRSYEGKGFLKIYIAGNPYSLFNPLFVSLGVNVNKLRKDVWEAVSDEDIEYVFPDGIKVIDKQYRLKHNILTGDLYAIEWAVLHPVLKQWLIIKNPLYKFDEEYAGYAMEGNAINDQHIKLGSMPLNYSLRFIVRINNINIGIFKNDYFVDKCDKYFCKEIKGFSQDRNIFAFEFNDLVDRCVLVSLEERRKLENFKNSFRKREVVFSNVNIYYLIEEVYFNL